MKNDNQALQQAIKSVSKGRTTESDRELYRSLLASTLFVAVDDRPRRDSGRPSDDSTVSLLRLGNPSGQAAVLGFTDITTLNRWRLNAPYVELAAQQLFQSLISIDVDMVVIDGAGPIDAVVQRTVFGALAEGIIPIPGLSKSETIPPGTTLWYREASAPIASELGRAFRMAMQSMDGIVDAYLTEQRARPDLPASLVLVVGFKPSVGPNEKSQLINQLGAIPSQLMPAGESLCIKEATDTFRRQMAGKIQSLIP